MAQFVTQLTENSVGSDVCVTPGLSAWSCWPIPPDHLRPKRREECQAYDAWLAQLTAVVQFVIRTEVTHGLRGESAAPGRKGAAKYVTLNPRALADPSCLCSITRQPSRQRGPETTRLTGQIRYSFCLRRYGHPPLYDEQRAGG